MTMRRPIITECNCDRPPGSDDGKRIFESIFAALKNKTVPAAA